MAQLTPFTYRFGRSNLHYLDTRYKFVLLCCISIAVLKAHFISLGLILILFFFLLNNLGLGFYNIFKELKFFIILLFIIFIARAVTIKGDAALTIFSITFSWQGIEQGLLVALRFFIVMIAGMLFSSTTKPSSIKSAVQWFLRPIPFIPEKRVAVMISLTLGFLPLILKQANEISDAQKARCANLQRNPVKKIYNLSIPLLKKTFQSADNLILAMEARCYSEERTDPVFTKSGSEFKMSIIGSMLTIFLILF